MPTGSFLLEGPTEGHYHCDKCKACIVLPTPPESAVSAFARGLLAQITTLPSVRRYYELLQVEELDAFVYGAARRPIGLLSKVPMSSSVVVLKSRLHVFPISR